MSTLLKWLAAPIAAVALLAFSPGLARADSVSYHTVVKFTGGPAGSSINGAGNIITFANGSQLTATGVQYGSGGSLPDLPLMYFPGVTGSLGSIRFSGSGTPSAFSGVGLQIDVIQDYTTPPTSPPGPGPVVGGNSSAFVGSAIGTVFTTPGINDQFDSATIQFNAPFQFVLPNPTPSPSVELSVMYTVAASQQIRLSSTNNALGDISVNVQAVPLPATATTGLGLLGGLACVSGGFALRRRLMGFVA